MPRRRRSADFKLGPEWSSSSGGRDAILAYHEPPRILCIRVHIGRHYLDTVIRASSISLPVECYRYLQSRWLDNDVLFRSQHSDCDILRRAGEKHNAAVCNSFLVCRIVYVSLPSLGDVRQKVRTGCGFQPSSIERDDDAVE